MKLKSACSSVAGPSLVHDGSVMGHGRLFHDWNGIPCDLVNCNDPKYYVWKPVAMVCLSIRQSSNGGS